MKRNILVTAAALVLLVAGWWFYSAQSDQTATGLKPETALVVRATLEDSVSAQGTLEPKDYVDVGAQISGQLKTIYVKIGDKVKEGELLAELDPKTYQSRVQGDEARIKSLEAQHAQQKAQADYDRLQWERTVKLKDSKAISQQEAEEKEKALKISEATVASIEAQIAEAQASLETDKINLGYTKIFAPMAGVVADIPVRVGQTLNANQTTPTILQIANMEVMTIRAQVAEADIMRLKPGMEASFVTLGAMERKWKGTIRQILPTPEVVNDVVLFEALIDVDNPDGLLMNGMSTQNTFLIGRAENALTIPLRALGRRLSGKDDPQRGQAYMVQVSARAEGSNPQEREVFVGLMTRGGVEVKAGLNEGERVLLSGAAAAGGSQNGRSPGKATGAPPMLKTGRL